MPEYRLDKIDRALINSLKHDARRSITDLAKDAGVSRPTVMKRLATLIKKGILGFEAGLNLKKLGFRVSCVGLEVTGTAEIRNMQKFLTLCPRVLLVLCPFEKTNFSVYVFGEDQETLRSVVHSLREFPNSSIAYIRYSDPPVYPKTFPVSIHLNKGTETPCGKVCSTCISYTEGLCVGCPAVVDYKGPL